MNEPFHFIFMLFEGEWRWKTMVKSNPEEIRVTISYDIQAGFIDM